MTAWNASVLIWLVTGSAGLLLACWGLTIALRDSASVEASGQNGLLLHLSRATVRTWAARVALQVVMIVFALLAASIPAPVLPEGASAAAVVRLLAIRWSLSLVCVMFLVLSAVDIGARQKAAHIIGGGR